MTYWNTGELNRLRAAHKGKRPKVDELWAMFPGRSRRSVEDMAGKLDLRHPIKRRKREKK